DKLPGRLPPWGSRAEEQGTKKDHSTRTRNGHLVYHTETYMRELVRSIEKREDQETYDTDRYDEELGAADF
ncbi:MAG TPA: hypothetical protein VEK11_24415, partial [Thermoanaerobaculia bacterium]|nr:hypothetical protein [Thermoanaerobaculia bacterium]